MISPTRRIAPSLWIVDLLVELAAQGHLVGVERGAAVGVGLGDVAPHAERPQAVQPRLALRLAPGVAEHRVARPEDDVGDDLLEARVVLDL